MMPDPPPLLCVIGPLHPRPQTLGGVAIKNAFLVEELRRLRIPLDLVTTHPRSASTLARVISRLIIRKRIIISVSQNGRAFLLPLAAALSLVGSKKVIILAGGGSFAADLRKLPRPAQAAYRMLLNCISQTFLETKAMVEDSLSILGPCKLSHLPNFKPRPTDKPERVCNTIFRVVYVGRITPTKGVSSLVDAVRTLLAERVCIELDIYGPFLAHHPSGQPEVDIFQGALLRALADCGTIKYRGILEPSSIQDAIRPYDVLAFPTLHTTEGFPGVLVDAAFAGLAVVASDIRSTREIVKDGWNGLLFPPGNVSALVHALRRLCEDRTLRERLGRNNWESSARYDARFAVHTAVSYLLAQAEPTRRT